MKSPFSIDFDAIDRDRREWRETAKSSFVNGIDPADIRPGSKVTISPNLVVHDRSYTNEVMTVVAVNACNVQLRRPKPFLGSDLIVLSFHEHHFYAADDFLTSEAA